MRFHVTSVCLGLGKDVSVFFSSVTPLSFMLGPLEIKKKVKTKKVRHKEEIHAESKPLQIIHKEGKTKKTEHQMFQQFLRNKLESTCGKSEEYVFIECDVKRAHLTTSFL